MPVLSPRLKLPVPLGVGDGSDVPHWFDLWKSILDDAAIFTQGTLAQRPNSTVPSPGVKGRLHYVTGDVTTVNNGILWLDIGTSWVIASTTGWYRPANNVIKTDGQQNIGLDLIVRDGTANQLGIGQIVPVAGGTAPGMSLGSAGDTNIYRFAVNILKTDDAFVAALGYSIGAPLAAPAYQSQQVAAQTVIRNKLLAADANDTFRILGDGRHEWGAGGASAIDVSLYRSAANILFTDDEFRAALDIYARPGAAAQVFVGQVAASTPGIAFGPAADASIYRFAADVVRTDNSFVVGTGKSLTVDSKVIAGPTQRGKSIIATTETRTNVAFGTLPTPDQVTVVLPTDGLIKIAFQGMWQEQVAGAGQAAIFIGANQLKVQSDASALPRGPAVQAAVMGGVAARDAPLVSAPIGLVSLNPGGSYTADVATGQAVGFANKGDVASWDVGSGFGAVGPLQHGGSCFVFAAAGTYTVSVQFKSTSGSVTVKNRKLWVSAEAY